MEYKKRGKSMNDKTGMTECPYCKCQEYYTKSKITGIVNCYERFDGKEADNGEMYQGTSTKLASKYAYCTNCGKKLFKVTE
jgi:hypothetical protein